MVINKYLTNTFEPILSLFPVPTPIYKVNSYYFPVVSNVNVFAKN